MSEYATDLGIKVIAFFFLSAFRSSLTLSLTTCIHVYANFFTIHKLNSLTMSPINFS